MRARPRRSSRRTSSASWRARGGAPRERTAAPSPARARGRAGARTTSRGARFRQRRGGTGFPTRRCSRGRGGSRRHPGRRFRNRSRRSRRRRRLFPPRAPPVSRRELDARRFFAGGWRRTRTTRPGIRGEEAIAHEWWAGLNIDDDATTKPTATPSARRGDAAGAPPIGSTRTTSTPDDEDYVEGSQRRRDAGGTTPYAERDEDGSKKTVTRARRREAETGTGGFSARHPTRGGRVRRGESGSLRFAGPGGRRWSAGARLRIPRGRGRPRHGARVRLRTRNRRARRASASRGASRSRRRREAHGEHVRPRGASVGLCARRTTRVLMRRTWFRSWTPRTARSGTPRTRLRRCSEQLFPDEPRDHPRVRPPPRGQAPGPRARSELLNQLNKEIAKSRRSYQQRSRSAIGAC